MTDEGRDSLKPVGDYQPLLELGQGGMGTAYLARALGVGGFERLVVVKRLHTHLLEHEEATRRFLDEARLAAYVHHANVVGVHRAGEDDSGQFIVLDYVEGASLDELVDRTALKGQSIPVPIVLRIALDALAGLEAIHQARDATGRTLSILHRDVSPHNVLTGRDGVSRICDFGIAKSTLASVTTDKAYVLGKLQYMAPEYLRRQAVGPALDVYGLGITLWVALAGVDPWPDADEAQLITHIFTEGVPRVSTKVSVPPQVDDLLAKACTVDPAERYAAAREMAADIEAIARKTGWLATHGEVASFVESLMGVDLERRRERIAEAIRRLEATSAPDHRRLATAPTQPVESRPQAPPHEGPSDLASREATTDIISVAGIPDRTAPRRSRMAAATLVAAVTAAGIGWLVWPSAEGNVHAAADAGSVRAFAAPSAARPTGPSREAGSRTEEVAGPTPASSSAASSSPVAPSPPAGRLPDPRAGRPRSPGKPQGGSRAAATARAPAPADFRPKPPAHSPPAHSPPVEHSAEGITTRNPYR